jgi:hypothetical protein
VKSRRGARRRNTDNSGHDGVYGQINIFPKEGEEGKPEEGEEQMSLF